MELGAHCCSTTQQMVTRMGIPLLWKHQGSCGISWDQTTLLLTFHFSAHSWQKWLHWGIQKNFMKVNPPLGPGMQKDYLTTYKLIGLKGQNERVQFYLFDLYPTPGGLWQSVEQKRLLLLILLMAPAAPSTKNLRWTDTSVEDTFLTNTICYSTEVLFF